MKRSWEYFHSKFHRYLHSVYTQQKYLEWVKHTKGILLIELLIKKKKKKRLEKTPSSEQIQITFIIII